MFKVGCRYSRADIYRKLNVPKSWQGGDWDTGYHQHQDTFFIFASVGVAGRTGHDYRNRFDGDDFCWFAKHRTMLTQPQIIKIVNPSKRSHIFYRKADRAPFTYAGFGRPTDVEDGTVDKPVSVRWVFDVPDEDHPERPAEEIDPGISFPEGGKKRIWVNAYERNPEARQACLDHYGYSCQVCGINFENRYGEMGRDYIHVHHLVPLSELNEKYVINAISDLQPVCPNCHAMLHRGKQARDIEEVRAAIKDAASN